MPKEIEWKERTGQRDLSYSIWHREKCGRHLYCIDIDAVEYCALCNEPLALIELAQDTGQKHKSTTVMARVAAMAELPAYLAFYTKDADDNISSFRVSKVFPQRTEETVMTPFEFQMLLCSLRYRHGCYIKNESHLQDMIRSLAYFIGIDKREVDNFVQAFISFLETCYPR